MYSIQCYYCGQTFDVRPFTIREKDDCTDEFIEDTGRCSRCRAPVCDSCDEGQLTIKGRKIERICPDCYSGKARNYSKKKNDGNTGLYCDSCKKRTLKGTPLRECSNCERQACPEHLWKNNLGMYCADCANRLISEEKVCSVCGVHVYPLSLIKVPVEVARTISTKANCCDTCGAITCQRCLKTVSEGRQLKKTSDGKLFWQCVKCKGEKTTVASSLCSKIVKVR